MVIKMIGSYNRWRIAENKHTKKSMLYYEGLCPTVADWVTIAELPLDVGIVKKIEESYKCRIQGVE